MKKITMGFGAFVLSLGLAACGEEARTTDTVTFAGTIEDSSSALVVSASRAKNPRVQQAVDFSDYVVYCVSFESIPSAASSTIDDEGAFSVANIPADTPFGCFINDATTNLPVATIAVTGTEGAFGNDTDATMSISSNVSVNISLNVAAGTATLPIADIQAATTAASAGIDADDLHETSWTMSCLDSGNDDVDEACASFIDESPNVYFRVLKGTEDGSAVTGMGVWASEAAYTACGGIDMTTSDEDDIEGVTFTQNDTAAAFDNDAECELREGSDRTTWENLNDYYAVGPLNSKGDGYEFRHEGEYVDGDCTYNDEVRLFLRPGASTTELIGSFSNNSGNNGDASCADEDSGQANFVVKFTQQ